MKKISLFLMSFALMSFSLSGQNLSSEKLLKNKAQGVEFLTNSTIQVLHWPPTKEPSHLDHDAFQPIVERGSYSESSRFEKVSILFPGAIHAQEITVEIKNGNVFCFGDILLFSEEEFSLKKLEKGNMISSSSNRWPGGVIPYVISPNNSAASLVMEAINYLNSNTNLCLVPRTTQSNYVEFVDSKEECYSNIGMIGGRQETNIHPVCGFGSAVHEICHAAGMWHEQSRNDRDSYITVFTENIEPGKEHNFEKKGASLTEVGPYDYGSIMHYPAKAFSKNGLPTIGVKIPPGTSSTQLGNNNGLSSGDIASINGMYPSKSCGVAGSGSNISLFAPITVSPSPVISNQGFTISTNFINTGSTTFIGCYYAVVFDSQLEEVLEVGLRESSGLPPNSRYTNNVVFNMPALNVPSGQYIAAIYFRDNCEGEYFLAGNEVYAYYVYFQVSNPSTPSLSVSPVALNFNSTASNQTFSVTSNTSWTVSESLSWLSVSPGSGSSNGTVTVSCQANTSTSSRSGTISVSGTGVASKTIAVTQVGSGVTCGVPGDVGLVEKGYSYFTIFWDEVASVSAYSFRYKKASETGWTTNDNWTASNVISSLKSPCTEYIFQVRSVCGTSFSDWSPEVRFTTSGCGDPYCYSYGIAFGDWISQVSFAGISGSSQEDYGYANRTSQVAAVETGKSYPISLKGDYDELTQGSTYYWNVWIDFNQDNDFTDSGEQVFMQTASKSSSYSGITGNITIPSNAKSGVTRMRVAMSLSGGEGPCEASSGFREVEDYGVNIQTSATSLVVSPVSLNFNATASNQTFSVTSNISWTVSESLSWLSVSPGSGSNNGTVTVSCQANTSTSSRSGTITVSGTGVTSQTVTVTQAGAGASLQVSPVVMNFNATASDQSFSVTSNISWTVSESLSWLSVSPGSGSNNGTVTVSCQANTSTSSRSGTITVSGTGVTSQTVTVTQAGAGASLQVSPVVMNFNSTASDQSFSVTSNTSWTVSESLSWLSVSPGSGSNNGTVTVSCQANTSTSSRSGTITVSGTGVTSQTVTVTQAGAGASLQVSPVVMNFNSTASDQSFSVTSNISWTVSESLSWLSVSPGSGSNNGTVTVSCQANTSTSSRTGTITVSGTGVASKTVSVSQAGVNPTCSVPTNVRVSEKGYSWFTIYWDEVTGATAYSWRYKRASAVDWESTSDSWSSAGVISSIKLPCTEYVFQVRTVCGSSFSNWSPEVRVTMDGCGDPYCYSYGISFEDWISQVDFGGMSHASGSDAGYANNTSYTASAQAGSSHPIKLYAGKDESKGSTYYWSVWIDFNQDNDFSDAGEQVMVQTASSTASVAGITGNISIPVSAKQGKTRMRVAMSLAAGESPCATSSDYREIEDYGVNIQSVGSSLTVSPGSLSFSSSGETKTFSITSNTSWTVSESLSWLSVSPASGSNNGTVTVSCQANTSTSSRSGTITVSGTGVTSQTVTVTQAGAGASLQVTPVVMNFNATASNQTFSVTSNISWTVSESLSWLSVSPASGSNNGTVTVSCQANTSTSSRSGTITVSGTGVTSQTVTVTQAGVVASLQVSPVVMNFNATASDQTFSVTSNTSWTVSESLSWLSVSPGSGSDNGTVTVSCQVNTSTSSRNGAITVSGAGGASQIVTVTQAGAAASLQVSPVALNFNATASNQTFNVTSNTSWTVSESLSWLSVSPASGSNDGGVTVSCQANTSASSRSGTITVTGTGEYSRTVSVTQAGAAASLQVSPVVMNFNATASDQTFSVASNTSWTVSESLSWLSVSPASGTNNGTVTVACQANTSASSRSGTITVSGTGGETQTISVTQVGEDLKLSVSTNSLNFGANNETKTFYISSNTNWNVSVPVNWVNISPRSGTNGANVTVTCLANTGASSRTAILTVSGNGVPSQTVSIFQSGSSETLEVNPAYLNFGYLTGSQSFSIITSGQWTATKTASWISLNKTSGSGNGIVMVTVEENPNPQQRSSTITLNSEGKTREVLVNQDGRGIGVPDSWKVTTTENNHTVILPKNLVSDIEGAPLAKGDYIGIFFVANGKNVCAGNGIWTGNDTSFPVFGDDASTTEKDGMSPGECFLIKVWQAATQKELEANATFAPVGTSGLINATYCYVSDGFSMITQISASAKETLFIPLKKGWNTVSSYIVPEDADLDPLLAPATDIVQVVKDGSGATFITNPRINGIGSWKVTEGYRIKSSDDGDLAISGKAVDLLQTPVPIRVGWQIIPVFSRTNQNLENALSSLNGKIEVLKDNAGNVFLPDLSINTIGQLKPTQGYRLKAKSAGELRYPVSYLDHSGPASPAWYSMAWASDSFQYFKLQENYNTGSNATLIILAEAAAGAIQTGDEIGVFAADTMLCGAGKFNGANLAITIWGDDSTQPGRQGMLPGETYSIRLWKASENKVYPLIVEFLQGNALYQEDDIEIIRRVQLNTTGTTEYLDPCLIYLFPNPARDQVVVMPAIELSGLVEFRMIGMNGQLAFQTSFNQGWPAGVSQTIPLDKYPEGVYSVQIRSAKGLWVGKLILIH